MSTMEMIPEAQETFVDGYFIGSFAVATAAIEQILHENIPENTSDRPWSLYNIATQAHGEGVITDELLTDLLEINELRRSKLHYRGENGPNRMEGHIVERMTEQDRSPQDIRGEHAKSALRALWDVWEVAAVDIDPEKLP
ncbi:hypothetical protein NDI56_16855 [Haloarcula sp. S1CR25-12]|uniref:Uncharacterized protein n=1 Tax=Haloarcula saliterrae TaxID=2950534 RepID=A0ABU2FGV2_9EURY|nr:hypothetical protein [Haloarcula sp. S1CR25-12]MDS0261070.1 hypothetical protein [Haloarcula sp. S1CR25-12]